MNHFYFGSSVNCISISGKTVKEAKKEMSSKLQEYALILKERNDKTELIKAIDIGLKYDSDDQIDTLKNNQKPFTWIFSIFSTKNKDITVGVTYDKELLKKQLDKLTCLDKNKIIEPKNPTYKYSESSYTIVDEIPGNSINTDILYNQVESTILKEEISLDLEAINCYIKPQYTSKSEEVIKTKNLLNKYVSSKITYASGDKREILDGSIINKWLSVDENFTVKFDEEKAKAYVNGLSNIYNTIGRTRTFTTSTGRTVNVSGGDYGFAINVSKETQDLISVIKEGQTTVREPKYSQTAFARGSNDIGNTFVEIDLTNQHLWYYKNGTLIAQGNVVTGNVSAGHTTPPGVYRLKYKQKDAVLRGADYAAPVTFWMPFNGGIGIHDASWRSEFGGYIYKTDGSHGCVNCPYYLAKAIFDNIEAGTPVVCFN